jgi:LemA protein
MGPPYHGAVMTWLIVLIVIVVVVGLVVLFLYNGLINKRNRVENAWSQIDVQLKRRHDLIPNLVETVKGYAAHERGTLDAVVQARNAAISATGPVATAQAENQITGALRQLFALSEAYPDLKANQNFLSLQEELSATEGRVAYARQFYNDSVLTYNTGIQKFPAALIATRMGFKPREYFEADEDARDTPTVQF